MTDRYESEDRSPEARVAEILRSGSVHADGPSADPATADLLRAVELLRDRYQSSATLPDRAASARMLEGIRKSMHRPRRESSLLRRLVGAARLVPLRPALVTAAAVVAVAVVVVVFWRPAGTVVAESGAIALVYDAPDGSTVTLRPHSRLTEHGSRTYELSGEAFFEVARDEAHEFTVRADGGMVRVLGTRFTVGTWGRSVRVFVDEGSVRFTGSATGASLDLVAGESSALVEGRPVLTASFGREAAMDWMNGALVLDSQPLADVIDEISQHFAVRIDYPSEIGTERLSGRILLPDLDQALTDLGIVVGGEFVRTGPDSFRLERK